MRFSTCSQPISGPIRTRLRVAVAAQRQQTDRPRPVNRALVNGSAGAQHQPQRQAGDYDLSDGAHQERVRELPSANPGAQRFGGLRDLQGDDDFSSATVGPYFQLATLFSHAFFHAG